MASAGPGPGYLVLTTHGMEPTMSGFFAPPPPPERLPTEPEQIEPMAHAVDPVVRWRAEQLERAGAELLHATAIAANRDVDLHKAERMLRAGCPSHLLGAILL